MNEARSGKIFSRESNNESIKIQDNNAEGNQSVDNLNENQQKIKLTNSPPGGIFSKRSSMSKQKAKVPSLNNDKSSQELIGTFQKYFEEYDTAVHIAKQAELSKDRAGTSQSRANTQSSQRKLRSQMRAINMQDRAIMRQAFLSELAVANIQRQVKTGDKWRRPRENMNKTELNNEQKGTKMNLTSVNWGSITNLDNPYNGNIVALATDTQRSKDAYNLAHYSRD